MLTFPIGHFSSSGVDFLDSVISSVCCDLDTTISESYGGSGQTWANLIASPADSAAQTDYDFFLGADGSSSTDDPTFTGSAGDDAAYFALDGGDFFTIAGGNTTLINGMHKTTGGGPWWIAVTFRYATAAPVSYAMFATMASSSEGVEYLAAKSGFETRINVDRGSTRKNNNFFTGVFVDATDYVVIVSGDPSSSDDLKVWMNTTTALTDTDASDQTSSTNANDAIVFAARPGGTVNFANGARWYSIAIGNEFLDNTKAATIISHLETRHNREYTP